MRFTKAFVEGTLVRRYKRFLADVELGDGSRLTVHCPNPGRMTSCSDPGNRVLISDSGNPRRKLRHTLEMVRMGRIWVGVNTAVPNAAVTAFVAAGKIPELRGYGEIRREVAYGVDDRSRIDLRLRDPSAKRPDCYVEVKNATLRVGDHSAFPDAVTERGRKHLYDLAGVVAGGERGVIFFFVGRADCRRFRPADEVDPAYGETLREVVAAGVEPLAYRMRYTRRRVEIVDRLPVDL
ncbi:MAG: DNA/RNA nuclease SfsA [Thermoanaerobaculia bacterium]